MIAKFHSAPGHSMETTLTISLPPPQSVRAARGEPPRKENEKEKEREKRKREREEGKERERELEREREREIDRERIRETERAHREHEKERASKVHSERNVSYKDKFQRMREKYDKVTMAHETHQHDLEVLNAKMKKLQAENDLLLDAMYLADPTLYEQYFPETSDSAPQPLLLPTQSDPQTYSSVPLAPLIPYPASSHYASIMPPPGSMPPPPLSSSSTLSGPSHMPPPLHPMHSPSMSMPPPSSASTNGTVIGNGGRASHSSRRPSNASSRSRRSDPRGGAGSSAGVPLAPEDMTPPNGGRTPTREISTPIAGGGMDVEDLPLRSPRVNGSHSTGTTAHDRASLPGGPNAMPNGTSPSLVPRRQPEVPFPVPLRERDDDLPEREVLSREPASIDDDPTYNMTAYAAVNSPDEPDEDEGKMQVDA